jgi:hypothetical protein
VIRRLLIGALLSVIALPIAFTASSNSTHPPTPAVAAEIPETFLAAYQDAADTWDIDWALLAAIGKLECDHGRNRQPGCWPPGTINRAGARGPMQFLGSTWRHTAATHDLDVAGPPTADGHGYATDADGDGIADPWSVYDAVHAAARYLVDNHGRNDPYTAAKAYNAGPSNPNPTAGARYAERAVALVAHYRALAGLGGFGTNDTATQAPGSGACTLTDPTGTGGCVTPRTAHLVQQIERAFADVPIWCWARRPSNPASDHPQGRACDITFGAIGRFPTASERDTGWRMADWLVANAEPFALAYIIWDGHIWAGENWTPYTGGRIYDPTHPTGGHFDHIHVAVQR